MCIKFNEGFSCFFRIILKVGEVSVAVVVSAEHRKEAFEACRFGIDSIKEKAPIWKKEFSESGTEWLGVTLK